MPGMSAFSRPTYSLLPSVVSAMPCGDAEPFGRDERKNGDSIRPFSLNVGGVEDDDVRPVRDGGIERLAIRRRDAFVRLIDGGELVENLAGRGIHLVGGVIGVAQRHDGVRLSQGRGRNTQDAGRGERH